MEFEDGIKKITVYGSENSSHLKLVSLTFPNPATFESFIIDGYFKDKNELETANEAVNWWNLYLKKIITLVNEY